MIRLVNLLICAALAAFFYFGEPPRRAPAAPRVPVRLDRVVSMAPSFTEILVYLGQRERIVGVTVFCEGIDEKVERIGSFLEPDFERIIDLRPDVVLAVKSNEQAPLFKGLRMRELRVEVISAESIDDLRETVLRLGELFGAQARAERFLRRLDQLMAVPAPSAEAPRALFVVDHRPLFVAGGGSFVDDMLAAAGARNVFGDRSEPWLPVEIEEVMARDPDLIIDVTLPADTAGTAEPWSQFHAHLRAVRDGRVWSFPQVYCGIQVPDWIVRLREIVRR